MLRVRSGRMGRSLALLGLALISSLRSATPSTARPVAFCQAAGDSVHLESASAPAILDGSPIQARFPLHLRFRSDLDGVAAQVRLAVSLETPGYWRGAQEMVLRRRPFSSVDMLCEANQTTREVQFQVVAGTRTLATGTVRVHGRKFVESPGGILAASDVRTDACPRADRQDIVEFLGFAGKMEPGAHTQTFGDTAAPGLKILVVRSSQLSGWLAEAPVRTWVSAGGILAALDAPRASWRAVGLGLVAEAAGPVDPDWWTRISLHRLPTPFLDNEAQLADQVEQKQPSEPRYLSVGLPQADRRAAAAIALVVVYLLVVVSLLAVIRRRRPEAGWKILSNLALLSTAGGLLLCCWAKGTVVRVGRVTVVQEMGPGVYAAIGSASVLDPLGRPRRVTMAGYPWDVRAAGPSSGREAPLVPCDRRVSLPFWTRAWAEEALNFRFEPRIHGAIGGSAERLPDGRWKLTVRNGTDLPLEDCQAWVGELLRLPDLEPGAAACVTSRLLRTAVGVRRPVPTDPPGIRPLDEDPATYQGRVRARFNPPGFSGGRPSPWCGAWLYAWSRSPVQPLQVDGAQVYQDETLIVAPLDVVVDGPSASNAEGSLSRTEESDTLSTPSSSTPSMDDSTDDPDSGLSAMAAPQDPGAGDAISTGPLVLAFHVPRTAGALHCRVVLHLQAEFGVSAPTRYLRIWNARRKCWENVHLETGSSLLQIPLDGTYDAAPAGAGSVYTDLLVARGHVGCTATISP